MRIEGIAPDSITFMTAHAACQNAGRWEAAGAVAAGRDAACDAMSGRCEWPDARWQDSPSGQSFNMAIRSAKR